MDADVVCLQEVDSSYFPHLVKELSARGYEGMFECHTSGSDGVATFYKTDKFLLKNYEVFGFNEMLGEVVDLEKFENKNEHNQRLAQYAQLQDLKSEKELVIGKKGIPIFEKKFTLNYRSFDAFSFSKCPLNLQFLARTGRPRHSSGHLLSTTLRGTA